MRELSTDRLLLRAWREEDADFVFDMYRRAEVQRYIGRVPRVMESRDEAVARIAGWQALDHPVHAVWAVEVRDTGRLAGTLLLKGIPASGPSVPLEDSGDTEIGWHLHPESWGNGYATEAASAALAHGFAGGLTRIVAVTNPANTASQNVCLRIGMTHLGQTTAYYNTTCELFAIDRP
jgi:RimJ/RimL family protein N-acetyltransferase